MKKIITISLFCCLGLFSRAQEAGVRTATQMASIVIEEVVNLGIESDNLQDFVFANQQDYDQGITQQAASTFSVNANVPWKVFVSASQETFIGPEGATMPADVFSLAVTGSEFAQLQAENADAPLVIGNRGDAQAPGNTFTVDYKANPGYGYDPGTYQIDLIFTITPQ